MAEAEYKAGAHWENGFIQVYTGNGKGKTTAALGLALRAAGAGCRVFIGQFMKGRKTSLPAALERFSGPVVLKSYGRARFVKSKPEREDIRLAEQGLVDCTEKLKSGAFDLVILDEASSAVHAKLLPVEDLLNTVQAKPRHVELVITGRNADPRIIEEADLVTDMREIKHYHRKGIRARRGIEW